MLRKGDFCILLIVIFLFSCDPQNDLDINYKESFKKKYFKSYSEIYQQATDSIRYWTKNQLSITGLQYNNEWLIDSCLIFNRDTTIFYSIVLNKDTIYKNSLSDNIEDFAGFKINDKWYFTFMSISEPIVRSYWQDSVYAPLSFEKLSYVAYELRFKGMVAEIMQGHPEKVDDYFKRIFPDLNDCKLYPKDKKNRCRDSIIVYRTAEKYNYKLTKQEISEIQIAIDETKIPEGNPLIEKRSLWQKFKYGEKVFETEEWKTYLKQKYGNKWQENL